MQLLEEALSAIGALPPERGARPVSEVQVNIVAFLGGGTGSGILPDIAVMARHRILQLNLKHRLNIFCLLPEHVREATTNDVSWRKSNATATLMELVALSLVREQAGWRALHQIHAETPYEVRGDDRRQRGLSLRPDVDGLRGRRRAHHRPRPLYACHQRLRRRLPRTLQERWTGARSATSTATACRRCSAPPARWRSPSPPSRRRTAFARLTASKVLPTAGARHERAARPLSASDLDEVKEWDRALQPEDPPPFTEQSFQTAGRDRLDMLEARLTSRWRRRPTRSPRGGAEGRGGEEDASIAPRWSRWACRCNRLETRKRIYSAALARVQDQSVPSKGRPDRQLQRKLLRPLPLPGAKDRNVAAVTDDFNRIQRRNIRHEYLTHKKRLLTKLLEYVDTELQHVKRFQGEVEIDQSARDLEKLATTLIGLAWRAGNTHIHRRHIFDLPGMAGMNTGALSSPPVKRLYAT